MSIFSLDIVVLMSWMFFMFEWIILCMRIIGWVEFMKLLMVSVMLLNRYGWIVFGFDTSDVRCLFVCCSNGGATWVVVISSSLVG